jgi:hypothetical protein
MKKITIEVHEDVFRKLEHLGLRISVGPRDVGRICESLVAGIVLSGHQFADIKSSTDIFETVYRRFKHGHD